jgi:hypothetical protein
MDEKKEETGLTTTTEQTGEIVPSMSSAAVEAEIRAAITVALKFPRNEDKAFQKLMKACDRPAFAADVSYEFPRGGKPITGPSVYVAREAARVWGNVRYGLNVVADDENFRTIEAWAWDLESNTKVYAQDTFEKSIQRRQYDKAGNYTGTKWIKPDERDLRELMNRRGAICTRNCILQLMPSDLIDDAIARSKQTLQKHVTQDPEAAKKAVILAFSGINVGVEQLEQLLGHPIGTSQATEIVQLRAIWKSIADGNSTWAEYIAPKAAAGETGALDMSNLKAPEDPSKTPEKPEGGNKGTAENASPGSAQTTESDAERQRKTDLEFLERQQVGAEQPSKPATNGKTDSQPAGTGPTNLFDRKRK